MKMTKTVKTRVKTLTNDNRWEILLNPSGGYSWIFERGEQQG
jgi:hypothetical protein